MEIETTPPDELQALYRLVTATARFTGEAFFQELARQLASVLDVQYAFVSVFTDDAEKLRIVAFWDGTQFHDIGEYKLADTPCSEVIKRKVFHCPRGVRERFPNDPHSKAIGAESYCGVAMLGAGGVHFGHVAVVDTKPMDNGPRFKSILQIGAVRAAAEMERLTAEAAVLASERRLTAILQSTMDAIVTIDGDRNISVFNAAAERIFRCDSVECVGRQVDRFLSTELGKEITDYIEDANAEEERAWLWVPEGLTAIRANGEAFPIEASVSRTSIDGSDQFTIIFRDCDEREAAALQIEKLRHERSYLVDEIKKEHDFEHLVGESPQLRHVLDQVELVAGTDATVLLLGESGTGKELIARAVHARSGRAEEPLVKVDCAALPENLIESELFGHEKGSFTGAHSARAGRFELANGGTIFLDEIAELPLSLQAKLLRVLEDRTFERVGGNETIHVDVRVIAATNRELSQRVSSGAFRQDLYYRLNVFPLSMPALRDRTADIPLLAQFFVDQYARKMARGALTLSRRAVDKLVGYSWPGNVRELKNIIERAVILATGTYLDVDFTFGGADLATTGARDATTMTLEDVERQHILRVLDSTGGVIHGPRGAAKLLEINPSTLRSRMQKLGIAGHGAR